VIWEDTPLQTFLDSIHLAKETDRGPDTATENKLPHGLIGSGRGWGGNIRVTDDYESPDARDKISFM
jgi:hypothetical protein